jgi:hypothetical protein
LPFGAAASLAMLFFNASMRSTTFSPRGRGLAAIRQLERAGISTTSAEALLERMLNGIDQLCAERDRLKGHQGPVKSRVLGGRSW